MVFPAKRLIPHIKMRSSGIILLTFISVFDKIKQTRYQCRNCGGTDTDMKKIISLLLAIITAASLLSLTSCNEKNSAELYGYFDTDGMLYDYNGLSKRKFNSLLEMVNDELREYHELYDIYNEYAGKSRIFHFDMYRITDSDDLYSIGYDDYVEREGYCIVEWSENIEDMLPEGAITVSISRTESETVRRIEVEYDNLSL